MDGLVLERDVEVLRPEYHVVGYRWRYNRQATGTFTEWMFMSIEDEPKFRDRQQENIDRNLVQIRPVFDTEV